MKNLVETLSLLAWLPDHLEGCLRSIPENYQNWEPRSWEGVPGESFTATEHVCHLRDIEIDGYQVRIRRMLEEENPLLLSIDGGSLVKARGYSETNPFEALATFRGARKNTLELISHLSDIALTRKGSFEGYGDITLRALIHFLSSHDQQHLACMQWLSGKIASDLDARPGE